MWTYEKYIISETNSSGIHIIRIFMVNGEREETFFLEYKSSPDPLTIEEDAIRFISYKNELETEEVEE